MTLEQLFGKAKTRERLELLFSIAETHYEDIATGIEAGLYDAEENKGWKQKRDGLRGLKKQLQDAGALPKNVSLAEGVIGVVWDFLTNPTTGLFAPIHPNCASGGFMSSDYLVTHVPNTERCVPHSTSCDRAKRPVLAKVETTYGTEPDKKPVEPLRNAEKPLPGITVTDDATGLTVKLARKNTGYATPFFLHGQLLGLGVSRSRLNSLLERLGMIPAVEKAVEATLPVYPRLSMRYALLCRDAAPEWYDAALEVMSKARVIDISAASPTGRMRTPSPAVVNVDFDKLEPRIIANELERNGLPPAALHEFIKALELEPAVVKALKDSGYSSRRDTGNNYEKADENARKLIRQHNASWDTVARAVLKDYVKCRVSS